ncbi:xanthine dehydrogenase family protein subunit M [Nocardia sp. BMG111209]|uniref:FAD binding domain-containing protein n=1 Tax=Nocardia sp. BMG111209 TaxID=1160137 RepID=UPI0004782E79|nr:FAD binding domain-containing protein [Nocardia sp. BMG111209]
MDLDTIREVIVARERADLEALGPNSAVLAGGTWLFSEPQDRLDRLVDITALDWPALVVTPAGLEIAATCTLAEFDAAAGVREATPAMSGVVGGAGSVALPAEWVAVRLFSQACRALVASYKIRRAATVGGNVCLGLPAGAVLAALVALDGTAVVWLPDGGERSIPLARFVIGPGRTVLRPGEVVRSIRLDDAKLRSRTAFRKVALAPLGRSGAVVMGRRDADGRCAITLSAATVRPTVLEFGAVPEDSELVATVLGLDRGVWFDDPHGTPAWRRHVCTVLGREVLAELREVRS